MVATTVLLVGHVCTYACQLECKTKNEPLEIFCQFFIGNNLNRWCSEFLLVTKFGDLEVNWVEHVITIPPSAVCVRGVSALHEIYM